MNLSELGLVLLVVLVPTGLSAAEPLTVKQTFENYTKTWSKGDAEKMAEFYEPSEDVHVVISSGRSFTGRAKVREMFQLAFEEAEFRNVKLPGLKIHEEGNIAWATCRFQAELRIKPGSERFRLTSQGLYVLRRTKGVWRICSENFAPIHGVERVQPWDESKTPEAPQEKGTPTNG